MVYRSDLELYICSEYAAGNAHNHTACSPIIRLTGITYCQTGFHDCLRSPQVARFQWLEDGIIRLVCTLQFHPTSIPLPDLVQLLIAFIIKLMSHNWLGFSSPITVLNGYAFVSSRNKKSFLHAISCEFEENSR